MKYLIGGSRSYSSALAKDKIFQLLDDVFSKNKPSEIISGAAKGVDSFGEQWARKNRIPIHRFIPYWDTYGKQAGFIRNSEMVAESDAVLLIWDQQSRGTLDTLCKSILVEKRLKVYTFDKYDIVPLPFGALKKILPEKVAQRLVG